MLNNIVLWPLCGIMVIFVVALLLIWRELKKIYYRSLSYRETLDKSLAEVKNKGEEMIGKIGENTGRLKAVEDEMVEFKKSLIEVKSNVQLEAGRLEGKITGISERVTETRYNDFLNYSLRLVEEAKIKGCIDEKLYNTLLELFHNLKVDHYLK